MIMHTLCVFVHVFMFLFSLCWITEWKQFSVATFLFPSRKTTSLIFLKHCLPTVIWKKIPANNTLMRYREFNQSMNRAIYFISKSELVSQLYKKEEIETLLEESSHIATRRKEASEMLQVSACWLSLSVNLYNVPDIFTLYRLDMRFFSLTVWYKSLIFSFISFYKL